MINTLNDFILNLLATLTSGDHLDALTSTALQHIFTGLDYICEGSTIFVLILDVIQVIFVDVFWK